MSTPICAALERLIELADTASTNGADPDTTAWDEAVATGRAALKAEPEGEGPSLEQMYYWALKSIRQYGSDTLLGRADGGADDREWQRAAVAEMVRRAQEALDYGTPATPPAPEPGEVPQDAGVALADLWTDE